MPKTFKHVIVAQQYSEDKKVLSKTLPALMPGLDKSLIQWVDYLYPSERSLACVSDMYKKSQDPDSDLRHYAQQELDTGMKKYVPLLEKESCLLVLQPQSLHARWLSDLTRHGHTILCYEENAIMLPHNSKPATKYDFFQLEKGCLDHFAMYSVQYSRFVTRSQYGPMDGWQFKNTETSQKIAS